MSKVLPDGFTAEDIREALAAVERWGGVDDHCDDEGVLWRAPNAMKAMSYGLAAALRSRARRERAQEWMGDGVEVANAVFGWKQRHGGLS